MPDVTYDECYRQVRIDRHDANWEQRTSAATAANRRTAKPVVERQRSLPA